MFLDINLIKNNHIVGVQDSTDYSGKFLIKELIASNTSDCDIHIFCYDQFCGNLKNDLVSLRLSAVHFHDCLSYEESVDPLCSFLSLLSNGTTDTTFRKIILVIDSLSTLLLIKDFSDVYRMLSRPIFLPEKNVKAQIQVFALIHEDTLLNRNDSLKNLRHLCRVWVQVGADMLDVTIRKNTGKVLNQKYQYEWLENTVKITKKKNVSPIKTNNVSHNLPSSTFKLNLSEDEKKARNAVDLPYERNLSNKNDNKGGQIFYEPDDFDDWDEEDPDNDLEFS